MTNPYEPLEEDSLVNFAYFERLLKIGESSRIVSAIALAQHEDRPELAVLVEFSLFRSAIGALFFQWPSKVVTRLKTAARDNAPAGVKVIVVPIYHCCCVVLGGDDA